MEVVLTDFEKSYIESKLLVEVDPEIQRQWVIDTV